MASPKLTRRSFLAATGVAVAGGAGYSGLRVWQHAHHPGLYFNLRGEDGYVAEGPPAPGSDVYGSFSLAVTDLARMSETRVPVPFPAHSIVTGPDHPGLCILVEKWGPHACAVDYDAGEVLAVEAFPEGRQFIGHGVFVPGEDALYISEGLFPNTPDGYAEGRIGIRRPNTLELIDEFPTYGENPHEVLLLDGGQTLVVANQGTVNQFPETRSNLAYIDTASGNLVSRHEVERTDVLMAHMRAFNDGLVAIVTKSKDESPRGNDIYTHRAGERLQQLAWPEGLVNAFVDEILSIDVDNARRRLGATCPDAGKVVFWDVDGREVLAVHDFDRPLGIALTEDGRHYLVNDLNAGTYAIDADSLERDGDAYPESFLATQFTAPHAHVARPTMRWI